MARPISARHRIDGKLLLSAASVVACFLLAAPVFVATGSPAWAFHTSFALYNLGVLVPAMTAAATFNRTAVEPNEQIWLGETNFSGGRVAFGSPVLGLPFAILGLTNNLTFGLALLGGIGGISGGHSRSGVAASWPSTAATGTPWPVDFVRRGNEAYHRGRCAGFEAEGDWTFRRLTIVPDGGLTRLSTNRAFVLKRCPF